MEVKFLKAGSGDSILIHHNGCNILIDGGNDSSYLIKEVEKIHKNKEVINLLVITHHDDDHIKGIIDLLKLVIKGDFGIPKNFIERVIFNSPRLVLGKIPQKKERLLSYKQAHQAEELILKISPQWEKCTDESEPILFDDLKIDFLSPNNESIEKYSQHKGAYLTSDYRCDWKIPMYRLEKHLTDKSQDTSIPNASSIVLSLECEEKKILLAADVTPSRLESITNKLVEENGGNPVQFNYFKLPHHGSYKSLNKNILKNIVCNNYVISTNGKKYFHPNKRVILKVLQNKRAEQTNFIFNYEEALNLLEISDKEKKDYNFKLTPNNEDYGFGI